MRNQAETIKREVDLAGYVRSCGIKLERHGTKDLKGLCPFHPDKNPSLIITPSKQLFHCPSCGAGGSVIDFAAKLHKLTLREAIRKLSPQSHQDDGEAAKNKKRNPSVSSVCSVVESLPLERQAELLEKTVSFYEKTFADVLEGKRYLESRHITDAGLFTKHRTGYADGSLLKALPGEGKILEELEELGILCSNKSGRFERFLNCVVFPVFDVEGNIVTLYGRSVNGPISTLLKTGKRHVYLPDRPTGLFNCEVIKSYPEIVLVESVIDALSCEMAGINNVVSIQSTNGVSGVSDPKVKLLAELGVRKITLMLDGDKPGREASFKLMSRLSAGFEVTNIPLPDDHDPNSYLVKHGPEKLQELFSLVEVSETSAKDKEETHSVSSVCSVVGNSFFVVCGLRHYHVIGLEKKQRSLKATIRVEKAGRLHVDTIDFYSSRMRRQLAQDLCCAFEELPDTVNSDINKLLAVCERRSPEDVACAAAKKENESKTPEMTPAEKEEAAAFGRSPDLIKRILADYERCGLIGEENNKLLCYLAMTSRKMEEPLSVLILSSSGAGKTILQDTALNFCPPEDLIKLTTLSARALFYKERLSLKHKVLAIEEGTGAEEASYAIRNLISSDGLKSETAIRDPQTGKLTTMANQVDGPAAVFQTSTNPEIDAETRSRFLVTGMDESREQTRKILEFQRSKTSIDGLQDNLERDRALSLHRNFQRLLKPLAVVNPHAGRLTFEDDRLQCRRAQPQYLNIIKSVAFLRQLQKETKEYKSHLDKTGRSFIEVDETDLEIGHSLAVEVLGRSLDELAIPSRNLLGLIDEMLEIRIRESSETDREELRRKSGIAFTRRELREFTGWTNTRIHTHLKELVNMEYVIVESGRSNSLQTYKLLYDGQGKDGRKFIPGLRRLKNEN